GRRGDGHDSCGIGRRQSANVDQIGRQQSGQRQEEQGEAEEGRAKRQRSLQRGPRNQMLAAHWGRSRRERKVGHDQGGGQQDAVDDEHGPPRRRLGEAGGGESAKRDADRYEGAPQGQGGRLMARLG